MLTSVEVSNERAGSLVLSLVDPSNGFVIHGIEGLDPVKSTIVTSNFAQLDGVRYQSSRREARNLVFKLGLEPDYSELPLTVRELRAQLYNFLMPSKMSVNFAFNDDQLGIVNISGRVESFEAPLFAQDPEATISVICADPDFVRSEYTVLNGQSGVPLSFDYEGSVDAGLLFDTILGAGGGTSLPVLNGFVLSLSNGDNATGVLDYVPDVPVTDTISVGTEVGDKYVRVTRAGETTSKLWGVSPFSDWLALGPGLNTFQMLTGKTPNTQYTLRFRSRFGGL